MGYTHYWRPVNGIEPSIFAKISRDVAKACELAKKHGVEVQFELDVEEKPAFTEDLIRFNGIEDDGHETFIITPTGSDFEFCKTARKPYDLLVTAALCLLDFHTKGTSWAVEISSDGDPADWSQGLALAKQVREGAGIPAEVYR